MAKRCTRLNNKGRNFMDIQINVTQRPWGFYIKFFQEAGVWVKRVEVKPGCRLSLQKHQRRSEKWNIVRGSGTVFVAGEESPIAAGAVIDVPIGAAHRITNNGAEPLIFIEVATGELLSEDDIERLEDDYSRK
ncbi:MAG: phosphomannose isomerase type II C-terminal cupin domain [Candidatus Omnitrophica bacterium]|nr:phosphomannose isomerase type II C-terminal cupin domain [Candidatus Omnitrophota bacterium]